MDRQIRVTIDNEWDEDELRSDIYDVCVEVMTPELLWKYKYRALKDKDLLLPQYMTEYIFNQIDNVVDLYNTEYQKHRAEDSCGIKWYDRAITDMIHKTLERNLVI